MASALTQLTEVLRKLRLEKRIKSANISVTFEGVRVKKAPGFELEKTGFFS